MKTLISVLATCAAIAANAALTPDTVFDDIPGDSTIKEIVTAGGGGGGAIDTNEVIKIANDAVRTNAEIAVHTLEIEYLKLAKQDALDIDQMNAVDSGITADKVAEIDQKADKSELDSKRRKDDLSVYRKVKDVWTWTNWNNPEEPDARTAPSDFLSFANSPISEPIFNTNGTWWGANQFWPNGNVKYFKELGPYGDGSETNLNFAFTAYDETGTNELFRFGATATRISATDETLVNLSESGNQFIRVATTDFVQRSVDSSTADVEAQIAALQDGKRDKTDLAVYSTTKQWTHDDLPEGYEYGGQPMFMEPDSEWHWPSSIDTNDAWAPGTADSTELHFICADGYEFDARLSQVPTSDTLAKTSELAAGLAAKQDALSATQLANIADVPNKRPLTDNTCYRTDYTKWILSGSGAPSGDYDVFFRNGKLVISVNGSDYAVSRNSVPDDSVFEDEFRVPDGPAWLDITATRSGPICISNELYTTVGFVSNSVQSVADEVNIRLMAEEDRAKAVENDIIEELGAFKRFDIRVLDTLPEEGEHGVIYLVKAEDYATTKTRDEYLWSQETWRLIGSTRFDSSIIAKTITTETIPQDLTNRVSYINHKEYGGEVRDEDENGAVVIGRGAAGTPTAEYIRSLTNTTGNVTLRSMSVAIGQNARAVSADGKQGQSIAIGANSKATAGQAIAIGSGAVHWFEDDVTGPGAVASGGQSIAIGYNAKAKSSLAVQIGAGVNSTPNSLKFLDTFIVKDGKVQADVDSNTVHRVIEESLDPKVIVDVPEELTIKSHALTTLDPTNVLEECAVTPTGTRNYEIFLPNSEAMRAGLPISIISEIEGATTLGSWWSNKVTRLPAKISLKEPLPKTLLLEVTEYETSWSWSPVITRAYETNGTVTVEGTNLQAAVTAVIGATRYPIKNPRYTTLSFQASGVHGQTCKLYDAKNEELAAFTVE